MMICTRCLNSHVTNAWCLFDRVGKPSLFVKKISVGMIAAFTGSPNHFLSTCSLGRSAVISSATNRLGLCSHKKRTLFHHSHAS